MFRSFLVVLCVPALITCLVSNENYSTLSIPGEIHDRESVPANKVRANVFLVSEKSELLLENTTLFLNCSVTKWLWSLNESSLLRSEKVVNLTNLFKRVEEFSTTRDEDSNVTCLILRRATHSSLNSVLLVPSASENLTTSYFNMTCLIRSDTKISEAIRSKNVTQLNLTELIECPTTTTDHSECLNARTEGRYTCLLIHEGAVTTNTTIINDDTTTAISPKYYPPFRITVPDELADDLENKITSGVHTGFLFVLFIVCTLCGIVLWIVYLLLFVCLRRFLRHFGCCKRPKKTKKQDK